MDKAMATTLAEPFPPELVGQLPRIICPNCSKAPNRQCGEHKKVRCDVCSSFITERHIHLSYVGHADVTSRLLKADPNWTWEPMAVDDHGLPLYDTDAQDRPVGMWIKLTVGDVTRLGYGSCEGSQNDAIKVLIGDALRNAALRFGVAVALWAKGDRADPTAENSTTSGGQAKRRQAAKPPVSEEQAQVIQLKRDVLQKHVAAGYGAAPEKLGDTFQRLVTEKTGEVWDKDNPGCLAALIDALREDIDSRQGKSAAS
jgi:hypothetical protein